MPAFFLYFSGGWGSTSWLVCPLPPKNSASAHSAICSGTDLEAVCGPLLVGLVPVQADWRRHSHGVAAQVDVLPRIGLRLLPVVVRLGGLLRHVNLRFVH